MIAPQNLLEKVIHFCLTNKLIVALFTLLIVGWGVMVAPFDWNLGDLPRDPLPVDAIPDIGENQQIVFTRWAGRSPQDVEDQISYPLTVSLLGISGIKTVRSFSMFGFSSIYVIFNENVDFYGSRSRILEKLASLAPGTLPDGVQPILGPDATALGQVFWYTLEGRDDRGNPVGGWDLHELRSIQDFYVRYSLMSAQGVAEVASIGGFVQEYQIDVDPDAMRVYGVTLDEVFSAVRMSNLDVGARTIEVNSVEYVIRGRGFVKSLEDIENSVIKVNNNVPIYIRNIASVQLGPALRRGILDKGGVEAVGGVAVVRYGENPLAAIKSIKEKIAAIAPGLPKKTLTDGTVSQVTIVPFYDRTGLINETLDTLNRALIEQILVTVIVVLLMVMNLRSSILISGLLPLAVLMTFIAMKLFGVDANIVALSGIAIAIGTMVDMGIVVTENILKHLEQNAGRNHRGIIFRAVSEVGSAVLTAVATTVVSFLPVFTMIAAEGKLFKPLAFTKTFALIASIIVAMTIIPPLAHLLLGKRMHKEIRSTMQLLLVPLGILAFWFAPWWLATITLLAGIYPLLEDQLPQFVGDFFRRWGSFLLAGLVLIILANRWLPLGPEKGAMLNVLFVLMLIGGLLLVFYYFQRFYGRMLSWALEYKRRFMGLSGGVLFFGAFCWLGFNAFFGWLPGFIRVLPPVAAVADTFPGLGKEFMPPLDEGAFLYMPTTMPHSSIGEAADVLSIQDMRFQAIPEIASAVGKLGRADSPLDPAPVSMIETVIDYHPQFLTAPDGHRPRFKFRSDSSDYFRSMDGRPLPAGDGQPYVVDGAYIRNEQNQLIPDENGMPFRLWRPALEPALNEGRNAWPGIQSPDDIWAQIVEYGKIPGTTSAPRLQPIAARLVMLQSGMRAPMGIKVKGPDLETIEKVGLQLEKFLKEVPSVEPSAVLADRIVGKPYLEIHIDREAIARHGIMLQKVQNIIEVAIGGKPVTMTVEGRERYPIRIRYPRELRNTPEALERILIPASGGAQIPLVQLADIRYLRGPQVIKSEDTFLTGYVVFDKKAGFAEVDVVQDAQQYLQLKINNGEFVIPDGVSYNFSGTYENQVRSEKRLMIILPLALLIIFIILYLQFNSAWTTGMVFSGIIIAWAGGFILIWLYGQSWFFNFSLFGADMRNLFQISPLNLSVAVWVGFLALFGIASDNGVIIATYLDQVFEKNKPRDIADIRKATVEAGEKRVRPALMTAATTILALLPVLTSTGRGSDIMVPMAIPSFGGMLLAMLTLFVVPVLYAARQEYLLKKIKEFGEHNAT